MSASNFSPAFSAFSALVRFTPPPPLQALIRSAGEKLRPQRPRLHAAHVTRAQDAVLAAGRASMHQRATLLSEERLGGQPTIVLGGFVPDSTEQVFLLRSFLRSRGSVYYFHYPRGGFSLDLVCAQLDDLVTELETRRGQRPVVFGVSFGAGIALEWLRRARAAGRPADLAGLILVSPVACAEDVVDPAEAKPSTLLGRALKPYLEPVPRVDAAVVEKSRTIFMKMFEAGAQNQTALRALMTAHQLLGLRDAVFGAIQGIDVPGACERVQAMRQMAPLVPESPGLLSAAPARIFYAEKESAVLAERSPTRAAFAAALPAFFPRGELQVVTNPGGAAVQHASLIFHYPQFLPPIAAFYRGLKPGKFRLAA